MPEINKYTRETVERILNKITGECVEIGPERDAVGLIEIRYYADDKVLSGSVAFTPEQARLVADALVKQAFGENFCIIEK